MFVWESNSIHKVKEKYLPVSLVFNLHWGLAEDNQKSNEHKRNIQNRLIILDKIFDQGSCNDDLIHERSNLLKELQDFNKSSSLDMAQKAKIRWAIEGDENSKFFHGIINKKRSQLAIHGVLADGDWIVEPSLVKNEFLKHFATRFAAPSSSSITFDYQFPNRLTPDQIGDLERNVSYEEIKRAVWDCGISKSPGPDGFTFEFYRKYWSLIDHDVVAAVTSFFSTGSFPLGCNSSFITLIPKSQEAKMVKDFRPINFEKAFDSVRWDYLDVVLANFGFGLKWRSWIQGCLNSAMGSILVNGSPTSEFKFSKGLKQGDPLSPFLFILIMESLHLSFNNVVNAGLYNGIQIDESLNLSHLFYADDVIFVGKIEITSNLSIIVNVLKWFYLASGLKINLNKSKLMGIGISHDVVASAAKSIGCSILHTPFNYLELKWIRTSRSWLDFQSRFPPDSPTPRSNNLLQEYEKISTLLVIELLSLVPLVETDAVFVCRPARPAFLCSTVVKIDSECVLGRRLLYYSTHSFLSLLSHARTLSRKLGALKVVYLGWEQTLMEVPSNVNDVFGKAACDLHFLRNNKSETVSTIANLKKELNQLDAVIDKGTGTEVEAEKRMEVLAALRNIDHIHSMDLAQKAKIKWSIEGDENSNFFHGILNKKRNQMNIRGITIDGVWKEQT
ncbi:RNA-directed DNA polymerase, eukaryota [Tanacetum coccineum]